MGLVDRRDVDIDPHALDEEWVRHPTLYAKYATMAAEARQEYDESRAHLDLVKSEIDQDMRANPEDYDLTKSTDKAIEAAIPSVKSYRQALKGVIEAKHHMDVCNAVVSALDHRKTALQKLVDLFLADYFSKPKASVENKERVDEMEKRSVRRRGRNRTERRSGDDTD